jgi:hypothetical protein
MRGRYVNWGRGLTVWWPWHDQPTIYIPRSRLDDDDRLERTMAHELVHVDQWLAFGRFGFVLRWLTRRGRLVLEAQALAASCKWWHDRGITRLRRHDEVVSVLEHYTLELRDRYWLWYPKARCMRAIRRWLDFTQTHKP